MPSPRFVPRSYALEPKKFGTSESIGWKPARVLSSDQRDNLAAAQLQHGIALKLRRAIQLSGRTIEEVARANDIEPDQLGRLLRGDVIMRFEHLAWADRVFGLGLVEGLLRLVGPSSSIG